MHTYEIHRRDSNQHRPGHFGLKIDGVETDITVDPSQFMKKSLAEAIANKAPDPNAEALKICDDYAEAALQRRVDRLRQGSMIPDGIPMSPLGGLDTTRYPRRKRRSEDVAVAAFLNRGALNGLSKEQRKERQKRQADKHDCQADWIARRLKLIELRSKDLRSVLSSICDSREFQVDSFSDALLSQVVEVVSKISGKDQYVRRALALVRELRGLTVPVLNASHGFQYAYTQYLTGAIDLVNDDIRIWPLMTNTTLDTVRDAVDTFSDVTADEFDGANYSSGGLALDSQAVAVDDANDRAEFDAADETVSALGAGTRPIQGVALGKFNTNTADSLPLHWLEFASNKTPDGSDFTFQFNAEGILQAADG